MPKPRKPENRGLPARWRIQHGAYYYQVPKDLQPAWDGKQLFRLGTTLPEAYAVWSKRLGPLGDLRTMDKIFDRYAREVLPTKAPRTQGNEQRYLKRLRPVFGHFLPENLEPQHAYQYADKRGKKRAAALEIGLLKHVLSKAVEWGRIKRNPLRGEVRLEGSTPRTRYIEDWEFIEALSLPRRRMKDGTAMIQAYLELKLLTGLRKSDLLSLPPSVATEEGLHVTPRKTENTTGKAIVITWSEALRKAWAKALAARPVHIAPFVFCTRRGEGYLDETTGETSGFDSIWQRYMKRCLKETGLKERFTEHDIRAKTGSDAESVEWAQKLLTHADSKITQRVYRRKPERVRPLR